MRNMKRAFVRALPLALFLVAALAVPATSAAQGRRYSWDSWNHRYSRYGNGTFQLDGTFIGQQDGCALVQDYRGQVIPLVGNPGDMRRGEDFLMTGRIQYGSVCGTAFRVYSVDRVWASSRHRTLLYDRRYDGDYDRYRDRYGRYQNGDRYGNGSYGRYDRNGYGDNDRYDRSGNRDLVSLVGRLDDSGRCPAIRGDRGEYYDLVGDLRGFRDGAHVRVLGFLGSRSRCGGPAIDVQQIR
jgi:hypothetical protein